MRLRRPLVLGLAAFVGCASPLTVAEPRDGDESNTSNFGEAGPRGGGDGGAGGGGGDADAPPLHDPEEDASTDT